MSGRTKQSTAERNAKLVAHMLAGGSVKAFAIDHGAHPRAINITLSRLGWRPIWTSAEERAQLLANRKGASS